VILRGEGDYGPPPFFYNKTMKNNNIEIYSLKAMNIRKIIITTRQTILQDWEYEIEVGANDGDEDFLLGRKAAILEKIYNDGIEGHCLDNDQIKDETVIMIDGAWRYT